MNRPYWSKGAVLFTQLAHGGWTTFSLMGMTTVARQYVDELVRRGCLEVRPLSDGTPNRFQGLRAEMRLTEKGLKMWDNTVTRLLLRTSKVSRVMPLRRA